MIEVHPNLFVGDERDGRLVAGKPGWFVVQAAKEPFHREALGYTSHGAPKDDPEYLYAHRPGRIALNLIDAPDPAFIAPEAVAAGIHAIADYIDDRKVLVHCNQGQSRAPTIALLYLALHTDLFDAMHYDEAAAYFLGTYPQFAPAGGMMGFARDVWAGRIELPNGMTAPDPIEYEADLPERDVTNPTAGRNDTKDLSQRRTLFKL